MSTNSHLEAILKRDPVAECEAFEEVLGVPRDNSILLAHALKVNSLKKEALEDAGDTFYGITMDEYLGIAIQEGFDIVLNSPFTGGYDSTVYNEQFYILWNSEMGVLMVCESYNETSVNAAKIYYNIDFGTKPPNNFSRYISSGGFSMDDGVYIWGGDHDVREGLRFTLDLLREVNTLTTWQKPVWLWLLNYNENRELSDGAIREQYYIDINRERLNELPEDVRANILASNAG